MTAAILNARFLDFALGTLVGMAPGIFSLVIFDEQLEHAIRDPGIRYRPGKEEPPPQASRGW